MRSNLPGSAGLTRFTLLSGAAAVALTAPGVAFAQDAEVPEVDDEFGSNVIIVTSTKREQTLQETPISVSVTTGETLEQAQIRDVLDLQTVTPSLRVSQLQTASASTFIIRGFGNGDNNFGIEPSVGVFIDGVFRSRSAAALSDLPNVQRIEVLNGPQSTLFGKNASAGVISVVTREPQFDFGGSVEASYGNFNAITIKGDVTGPITDSVAFSIDGSYNSRDGYATIVNQNEEQNNRNRWSARGQLLIEPTPDIRIRAIADYSRIDEICCQVSTLRAGDVTNFVIGGPDIGGQFSTDFFGYEAFLDIVPTNEVDNYGGSVQIDWETGPISVTSITAYRELENLFNSDIDFTSASIATETRQQEVQSFTQELRIASDFDGPFNFLLGGYYFDETIEQNSEIQNGTDFRAFGELQTPGGIGFFSVIEPQLGLPVGSILSTPLLTSEVFSMDNTSWSIFGTIDLEPVDGLVLTAGFNYTDDEKTFALSQDSFDPLANLNLADVFIFGALAGNGVDGSDPAQVAAFATNPATAPIYQGILAGAVDPTVNQLLGFAALQFQPPFLTVPNVVEDGRTADDKLTYLFRASYQISPEINVYASYATGFKASSINLSRDSRPALGDFIPGPIPDIPGGGVVGGSNFLAPSSPIRDAGLPITNLTTGSRFAGPEEAEVYEVGLKAQWEGVGFNLALFDQTIEGFQSFAFTGLGFALANAGKQSVRGFELDATIQPTDGLVLTFATTHLDPLFDEFTGSTFGDISGQRPAGIPSWAISTSATYTHEFGATGNRLISRIDYSHESNTQILTGLSGFPTLQEGLDAARDFRREVNLVNASMTLALDNGIEVGAWARNLFNDQYILTIFPGVAQGSTVSGYPSQPRTYGGVVRFKF
ncbi:MAG: TonB-dependent receptor [Pseudomonadota bacterium]